MFANNDEMAIGAIQAMKSSGVDMSKVVVVGVDATQDGLAAMRAGNLDVTVFQNAAGQAAGAVDAALALASGQAVDRVGLHPVRAGHAREHGQVRGQELSQVGDGGASYRRARTTRRGPVCVAINALRIMHRCRRCPDERSDIMAGMVIIGAGECGTRAALALREAGYGGAVTLIGAEPHAPYERPPLSKDAITADTPRPKAIGGSERLAEAGIDFRSSRTVLGIDRTARHVLLDGETIHTSACSSRPVPARGPYRCPEPTSRLSPCCARWTTQPGSAPRSGPASVWR